ncbi:hypothetical protein SHIRM173S_08219 [Streptomyces hirsutus]
MKIDEYAPAARPTNRENVGDVVQHTGAEDTAPDEQQGPHRQQRDHRGVDGTDQGAVDGAVGDLAVRQVQRDCLVMSLVCSLRLSNTTTVS